MSVLVNRISRLENRNSSKPFGIKFWDSIDLPDGRSFPPLAITAKGAFEMAPDESYGDIQQRVKTPPVSNLSIDQMADAALLSALDAVRARTEAMREFPEFQAEFEAFEARHGSFDALEEAIQPLRQNNDGN